jgi:hypothetical protein
MLCIAFETSIDIHLSVMSLRDNLKSPRPPQVQPLFVAKWFVGQITFLSFMKPHACSRQQGLLGQERELETETGMQCTLN